MFVYLYRTECHQDKFLCTFKCHWRITYIHVVIIILSKTFVESTLAGHSLDLYTKYPPSVYLLKMLNNK